MHRDVSRVRVASSETRLTHHRSVPVASASAIKGAAYIRRWRAPPRNTGTAAAVFCDTLATAAVQLVCPQAVGPDALAG